MKQLRSLSVNTSLASVGFRFGTQYDPKEEEEHKKAILINKLTAWVVPKEVGCADLMDGLVYDFSEIMANLIKQNPSYKPDWKARYRHFTVGRTFAGLDDDMEYRLMTMSEFSKTDWRIKIHCKYLEIIVTPYKVAQVCFETSLQDHAIFKIFPYLLTRLIQNCSYIFELGSSEDMIDMYVQGNIYIIPTMLSYLNSGV